MELADVSRRVAGQDFAVEILDEPRIAISASHDDVQAFLANLLIRVVHVTKVFPQWRFRAERPELRFELFLELAVVGDPAHRSLFFRRADRERNSSRDVAGGLRALSKAAVNPRSDQIGLPATIDAR